MPLLQIFLWHFFLLSNKFVIINSSIVSQNGNVREYVLFVYITDIGVLLLLIYGLYIFSIIDEKQKGSKKDNSGNAE